MIDSAKEIPLDTDEAVEALLGRAAPRPVPPKPERDAVRDAVHAEWIELTGSRRRKRNFVSLAMAASVLVVAFISLNMLQTSGIEEVQVASIDKRFGSIYVLGDNAELLEGNRLSSVVTGQTLITDNDSGLALAWSAGGSLRIDENTRVEFVSDERIYLRSGRIYFDSAPALTSRSISGPGAALTVVTDVGEVFHVGTQYMTQFDDANLTVSVREGEVRVEGAGLPATATRGQQLAISGGGARNLFAIPPHGTAWEWIEQTSPAANMDGRSVDEFLGWISQETGLDIEYETQTAERYAQQELLNGTIDTGPRQALQIWMLGVDLGWRIEDGVIYVNEAR